LSRAGRGEQNLVYIKMSTGIGAGLLVDGKVYPGDDGSLCGFILTAMLGRRSSSMGAVIQALAIALHYDADRKEVMVARTNQESSLVTTT